MRARPALLLLIAVVAAGAAFVWWQRGNGDSAIESLLQSAEIELARAPFDRSLAQGVLRQVKGGVHANDPRLLRAQSRLELALGRVRPAWEAIKGLALEPEAEPQDLRLGAVALLRLHGEGGDPELASRALELAEHAYRAQGALDDLFVAWQAARRADRTEDAARLAQELVEAHADAPRARLVRALGGAPTLAELRQLRQELDPAPVELDFALAVELVKDGDAAAVNEAVRCIERVLAVLPSSVDARSVAAAALHRAGRREHRDQHLDWLLRAAPQGDERRAGWAQLRNLPAQDHR